MLKIYGLRRKGSENNEKKETICNYLKDETEMHPKTIFILMILF